MLVRRTLSLTDVQLKADGPKGTFEGYAARFGQVTQDGEAMLVKGCFASTLRKFGKPKMFFAHTWTMPIGRWTKVSEDDSGLYVAGELTPNLSLSQDVGAALQHGTIDGLSVGGFVKREDMTPNPDAEDQMLISKWTRLVEISPVVFPNLDGARITAVHGEDMSVDEALADVDSIREAERFLRDAGGLSKTLAAAWVSRVKTLLAQGEPGRKESEANERALEQRVERIRKLVAQANT